MIDLIPYSYIVLLVLLCILLCMYIYYYITLSQKILLSENKIIEIFLHKISKIPAVIEVMRLYIFDKKGAFDEITRLHSQGIIHDYSSVHMLLEHNARINDQYGFLMKLSMVTPELQKDTYFIYIREFVMQYDRTMRNQLPELSSLIKKWNTFIRMKNWTIIGYLLPGKMKIPVE